jgi:hypothetical protein
VPLAYPLTCVTTLIDVSDSTHSLHVFACVLDSFTACICLQNTATHCNTLQHTATHCNTLQHTATYCSRQREQKARQTDTSAATRYHTLHNIPTHYNTLQQIDGTDTQLDRRNKFCKTLTHCNAPHHTAPHCNILQ